MSSLFCILDKIVLSHCDGFCYKDIAKILTNTYMLRIFLSAGRIYFVVK